MVPFPIGSGLHFCFPFFATLCVVHWIDCAPFDGYSRGTIWISFDLQHGKMDKCTANIWPYNMIYISFEMKTRKKNSRNRMENNSGKKVGERTRAVHITNHQCGRWQANYCVILIPAPALCVHVRAHIVPFCVRTTFFLLRSCFHSIPQWLYSRHVLHSVYYLRAFWIDAVGRCFRASGHTKRQMANKKTTTTKWNATVHFYGCVLAAWVLCVCLCAMHNANRKIDRLVCRSSIV